MWISIFIYYESWDSCKFCYLSLEQFNSKMLPVLKLVCIQWIKMIVDTYKCNHTFTYTNIIHFYEWRLTKAALDKLFRCTLIHTQFSLNKWITVQNVHFLSGHGPPRVTSCSGDVSNRHQMTVPSLYWFLRWHDHTVYIHPPVYIKPHTTAV